MNKKLIYRILIYIVGIFFLAFSVVFSVNCNLGTIAGNMLSYILSVVCNKPLSTFTTVVFVVYVALQALILKKDFKPVYLCELIFTVIFGYFVAVATAVVGKWVPANYIEQLVQLFLCLLFTGIGVAFYINVNLVPMPPEAFSLAIIQKNPKLSLGKVRIIQDIVTVVVSLIISFVCLGKLDGFREGTVITAILSGVAIDLCNKPIGKFVRKVCFDETDTTETKEEKEEA